MVLFVLVLVALLWMHFAILRMEKAATVAQRATLPQLPELAHVHRPEHKGALGPSDGESGGERGRSEPIAP
jgi:NNP family nitrate/nitrite transporter-like MFS transporter